MLKWFSLVGTKTLFDWKLARTNAIMYCNDLWIELHRFKICYVVILDCEWYYELLYTVILSDFLFFWIWRLKDYVNFRKPNSSGTSELFWTNSEPLMQGTQQKCWPFTSFLFSFFFFWRQKEEKLEPKKQVRVHT